MYEAEEGRAESANPQEKIHLDGKPSVTVALDQYKYGDEIIVQVYNKAGSSVRKERVNENYDRIQVFFKLEDFLDICKKLLIDHDELPKKK